MLGLFSFQFTDTTAPPSPGCSGSRSRSRSASAAPAARCSPGSRSPAAPRCSTGSRRTLLAAATCNALITSIYFVPILSGLGAIQLAQEPDGILALAGQQKLRKKREKARLARIAEAEAEAHGGRCPSTRACSTATDGDGRAPRRSPTDRTPDARGDVRDARHRRRLRRRRGAPWCRPATSSAGKITALLGANGAGQVDAVLGRRRHGRRDARQGVPRGHDDHRRSESFRRAHATACCSCPRRAASSPASPSRRTSPCSCATRSSRAGRVRAVPDPARAAQAGRGTALGRRAADAEPGAGARRPAGGAHRRRADARARAARGRQR